MVIVSAAARACAVYCSGLLLYHVQTMRLFNDSKTFVDMPMKSDPERILSSFAAVNASNEDCVQTAT